MAKNTSTKRNIANNTIYQLIGKGVSMSITVLATMIVAKMYGREDYGAFSLMQSWPAFFFIIADFGINAISVRELTKDWSKAEKYFNSVLVLRTIFSLFLVILLSFVLFLFPYSENLLFGIRLSLLLILTQSLYATTNIIFQSKMKYDYSTIGYVGGYVVILLLIMAASFLKIDIVWLNFSYVIGGFLTFFVNLHFVKKLGIQVNLRIDRKLCKNLLKQALPLGLMFIFSQMSFKEDTIMLSFLKLPVKYGLNNTESVAVYALPYKVFEVTLVVPTFFMNAAFPTLVRHMEKGEKKLKYTLRAILEYLILGGIISGFLVFTLSPFIVQFLGGSEFNESVNVLKILSVGFVFFYVTSPLSWLIVAFEKQYYLPKIYLASALFNLAANLIFIPIYSFYAATVITILSEILVLVLLIYSVMKAWRLKYA